MDEQKQQLTTRINQAQNILVTVSANPSVDQLSAAIGLTVALNKLDKHGTAVFSGAIPSTLEFLKPEDTLEKNTDSLRDFIIALDKSKADKLRYKVEDQVVRIFITPYKTSLSQKDLEFSQGDFNVDVVIALGVTEQQDLDTAITAHGRILHDATVASVSTTGQGSLGTINWVDPASSSLSEMVTGLVDALDKKVLDNQIATALLTGIVANTDRFRNEKTSPKAMSVSAELMAAGANQQLIATELEAPVIKTETPVALTDKPVNDQSNETPTTPSPKKADPGTLEIDHEAEDDATEDYTPEPEVEQPQVHVDENGQLVKDENEDEDKVSDATDNLTPITGVRAGGTNTEGDFLTAPDESTVRRERIMEPPQMSTSNLTANVAPEGFDPSTEELSLPPVASPLLTHNEPVLPPTPSYTPNKPADPFLPQSPLQPTFNSGQSGVSSLPSVVADDDSTLTEIEESVHSPHVQSREMTSSQAVPNTVDSARDAVEAALQASTASTSPIAALNAQPLGPDLHSNPFALPPSPAPTPVLNTGFSEPTPGNSPADETLDMPLPSNPFGPAQLPSQPTPAVSPSAFPGTPTAQSGQTPPPPVPPPMLPPLQ